MTSMGQYKSNAIRDARSRYGEQVIINNPASPYNGRMGTIISYNFDNDLFKVRLQSGEEHNFHEVSLVSMVNDHMGYSGKSKRTRTRTKRTRTNSKRTKKSKKYSRKY
jgi:hypothetical protein